MTTTDGQCPQCGGQLTFLAGYPEHHNNQYCVDNNCGWEAWINKGYLVKRTQIMIPIDILGDENV